MHYTAQEKEEFRKGDSELARTLRLKDRLWPEVSKLRRTCQNTSEHNPLWAKATRVRRLVDKMARAKDDRRAGREARMLIRKCWKEAQRAEVRDPGR